ncbi:MAG: diguanylate cyclase [Burkholderiaceae bacterium]|nr:diguanylate cyclase [Burkholderiaceae bacterium]
MASLRNAQRQARRAWNLLHVDAPGARRVAERVLASNPDDAGALGWAQLVIGMHTLLYSTAAEAETELRAAERSFLRARDRAGLILARAQIARARWRQGHFQQALSLALPLRDEGLSVLRHEQRAMLLNTIAGCFSAYGDSAQAFAYMYEALRDAGPRRGRGFDTVLHCNLSHELMQIGDYEEALRHVAQGLDRCRGLDNQRLTSVLLINRVACLTELGRAEEALADVATLRQMPATEAGRGRIEPGFETLAIAALRAGDRALGQTLLAEAEADGPPRLPDHRLERVSAQALLALAQGRPRRAVDALLPLEAAAADDEVEGQSLRIRGQFFDVLSQAWQALRRPGPAVLALRAWQDLHRRQAQLASQARYQAAALQTELTRLQHRLDEKEAEKRATERARGALVAINEELNRRVREVQSLQEALRQQATQDPLTGLFNRRHLNDTLPQLHALALREGQPLALVIIDLDHFKRVNDRHGHAAGDQLLSAFGELLATHSRRSDVACRYGGEEFCLLMPRTDAAAARRKAQALLREWRAARLVSDGQVIDGLSFSAGAADTWLAPGSPDALLKAADDALLAAKRAGRNRVGTAAQAAASAMSP